MKKRKLGACQIISQRKQFSGYHPGVFYKVGDEEMELYNEALRMKPVVPSCDFFHARNAQPSWSNKLIPCKSVGNLKFFKEKQK